jgi:site-specific DNA-methyltransferase (adenine-specific)
MAPVLRHESDLTGSQVWQGDARQVAANLPDDCASLAILDGPYGMHKAAWDRLAVDELPEWYRPHLQDVDRLLAPSASLYFWNTAAGWAAVHPMILSMGWTFRALVTWDKTVAHMAGRVSMSEIRTWFDVTEVCGFYHREAYTLNGGAACSIAYAAGADERNWIRPWVCDEWAAAGLRKPQADDACGVKTMASRHYFPADQWLLPTWEHWQNLAKYATTHGAPRRRPYFVHPDFWTDDANDLRATYDHLRAEYDHLRAAYDHLRAEYEASRPPFVCPMGIGNV